MPLNIQTHKPLKEFSTFGIGGMARFFVSVKTIEELQEALLYTKTHSLPFHVVGKGSNSLFSDEGFNGLVIHNQIAFFEIQDVNVHVGAGYSFSLLGIKTAKAGLGGLEFASGIPGSVGGAIFMNAGANGGQTSDVVEEVTFVTQNGTIENIPKEPLDFSYRKSCFHHRAGVIAAAKFRLKHDLTAREKQLAIIEYRKKTQPLQEMSCGCIFRNPSQAYAGQLIEQCGLKGLRVGGAEVSTHHANFIINKEGSTARDVLELIQKIKTCVKEQTGIELEMELREISHD